MGKLSKSAFSSSGSRIKGNHQPRKGRTMIYIILLVAIVIAMVGIGRIGKGPSGKDNPGAGQFSNPLPNSSFSLEGKLELYNQQDSLIVKIDIEIADDEAQTTQGLMYRRTLGEKEGMLFIFPGEEVRSFWMKNTYIPLDLIFLDTNRRIVHIHESAQPRTEASIPSIEPAKYVLEVNEGFSSRYFLAVGDSMHFVRVY